MVEKRKNDPLAFTEHCRDAQTIVRQMKTSDPAARQEALKTHLRICPVCRKVLSTYFSAALREGETNTSENSQKEKEVFTMASSGSGNKLPDQAVTVQRNGRGGAEIVSATGVIKNPVKKDDPLAEASVIIGNGESEKRLPFAIEIRLFSTANLISCRVRSVRSAEKYSVVIKPVLKDGRTGERIEDAKKLGNSSILFPKIPKGRYRLSLLGEQGLDIELAVK